MSASNGFENLESFVNALDGVSELKIFGIRSGALKSDPAVGLKDVIGRNPAGLRSFIRLLRASVPLRGLCPLLIDYFFGMLLTCEDSLVPTLVEILEFLPKALRPMETYTLCMESWVTLYQKNCTHQESDKLCRLALARSLAAQMITELLTRTEKGPLHRNRLDYFMSFGLQMLSKYFNAASIPFHKSHIESHERIVSALLAIVSAVGSPSQPATRSPDVGNAIESEVCIKLLASLIEFNIRCKNFPDASSRKILQLLLQLDSSVINTITTRVQIISLPNPQLDDTGGYEVSDQNIALMVLCIPDILPSIWKETKRIGHLCDCSVFLLENSQGKPWLIREAVLKIQPFLPSINSVKLFRLLIETATSQGDEEMLSLEERQEIFLKIQESLLSRSSEESTRICSNIVSESRIDSCVGLFTKIAKDIDKNTETSSPFYSFARSIFRDNDVDVLNASDAFKSILNWARWFYLSRSQARDKKEDEWLRDKLDLVSKRIDVELRSTMGDREQETRVLFIGHLVARVKELMR